MTAAIGGHAIGTTGIGPPAGPPIVIPPWSGVPPVVGSIDSFPIAEAAPAGTWLRIPPVVTITSGATATLHRPVFTWSYSSPLSKPQAWFQVEVQRAPKPIGAQQFGFAPFGGGAQLHDSGQVAGTAGSYKMPFTVNDGDDYIVIVTASDGSDQTTVAQAFTVAITYLDITLISIDGAAAVDVPVVEDSGTSGELRVHLPSIDGATDPAPLRDVTIVGPSWSPGHTFPWVAFITGPKYNNPTGGRAQVTTSKAVYVSLTEGVSVRVNDLADYYMTPVP